MFTLPETFIKKFDLLPKYRKQEVIDFLDFVFDKHLESLDEKAEESPASDELKQFLAVIHTSRGPEYWRKRVKM